MLENNFLKKAVYWPAFFLYIFFIASLSISLGYQLTGTIQSRYSGIIKWVSINFSNGSRFVPSATLPEIVSSYRTSQSSRSALPSVSSEVIASWYGSEFHEKLTASGQTFDMHKNTLAHRTLPLGTKVRLINLKNGKSAEGVVNDRGPFIKGRDVDVSYAIAKQLGFVRKGTIKLIIEPMRMIGKENKEP
jgi:rare lipoprotein A (peptidoglycan hydrolase)